MKILLIEYITGGGLATQTLPDSLRQEGMIMLQSLANDLSVLANVEVLIPLDYRCRDTLLPASCQKFVIPEQQSLMNVLADLIAQVDAVWPIAPETDNTLITLAEQVNQQQKCLLLSSMTALIACSDKWSTFQLLQQHHIATIPTWLYTEAQFTSQALVVKKRDGCGCQDSFILHQSNDLPEQLLNPEFSQQYIVQPYTSGKTTSLSAIFKQGQAWLLCANEQQFAIRNQQLTLTSCLVNIASQDDNAYKNLLTAVAKALPGLFGYIGIDLIEPENSQPLLLEINPRLTTPYVGIAEATGINVAAQVLKLLTGEPDFKVSSNQTIRVNIH